MTSESLVTQPRLDTSRLQRTRGLTLDPLSSIVIAERVLRVTTPVMGLLPPALSIAPFASCYVVSMFELHSSVLGLGGITYT